MHRRTLLAASALLATPALAQDAFPNRPIRVVVPFPAGGTTDLLGRLFAQRMTETLGQPVLIENRGGGGGSIGADVVAKAAPDGYVLLLHNLTFPTTSAVLALAGRAPHDIERDFVPVSLAARVPFLLLANPAVPGDDLRGFVVAAKAASAAGKPFFYGSTGPGSAMNLFGEVIAREGGFTMEHIPFRGAAPLVQELLAGRVQLGGDQISTSLERARSGALKPLAVHGAQRVPALPNVATVAEQGFPSLQVDGWNGFFAPARTPDAVVAKLQGAIAAAARHPDVVARCNELAAEPVGDDSAAFAAMVRNESRKIAALVAEFRLKPE